MVGWEAKGVKVLRYCYNWGERIEVDVSRRGEVGFDQLSSEKNWVGGFKVEAEREGGEDGGRNISPGVRRVVQQTGRFDYWACELSEMII